MVSSLRFLLVVCIWRHQKHDCANYDQFAPNFGMLYKTIHMSLHQIWRYLDRWKQRYRPKESENVLLWYIGKWDGEHSFAHQHGYRNITWNLQRYFKMLLLTLCESFVTKVVNSNFFMTSLQTKNSRFLRPVSDHVLINWVSKGERCIK